MQDLARNTQTYLYLFRNQNQSKTKISIFNASEAAYETHCSTLFTWWADLAMFVCVSQTKSNFSFFGIGLPSGSISSSGFYLSFSLLSSGGSTAIILAQGDVLDSLDSPTGSDS